MDILAPRALKAASWLVMAALVSLGYLWQGGEFALGVLVGGVVVVVNFHLLHRALRALLEGVPQSSAHEQGKAKAFFAFRQILRFTALLALIFILVAYDWVNVLGMLLGLSTVAFTLILVAIYETIKLKHKEADPSHGTSHPLS
jgi:hypothetical protein